MMVGNGANVAPPLPTVALIHAPLSQTALKVNYKTLLLTMPDFSQS